jgi:hypothetical protein
VIDDGTARVAEDDRIAGPSGDTVQAVQFDLSAGKQLGQGCLGFADAAKCACCSLAVREAQHDHPSFPVVLSASRLTWKEDAASLAVSVS